MIMLLPEYIDGNSRCTRKSLWIASPRSDTEDSGTCVAGVLSGFPYTIFNVSMLITDDANSGLTADRLGKGPKKGRQYVENGGPKADHPEVKAKPTSIPS